LTALFDVNDRGGKKSSFWQHGNVKDGWLQIDFKDRRLRMTHYAIHNNLYYVRELDFLKTWTMEGSMTGDEWTVIDSRVNEEGLHGKDKVEALFTCNGDTRHSFRFIRLFQRGPSHDPNYYYFLISQLEVFGHLECSTRDQRWRIFMKSSQFNHLNLFHFSFLCDSRNIHFPRHFSLIRLRIQWSCGPFWCASEA
jgi:hypothetical protein